MFKEKAHLQNGKYRLIDFLDRGNQAVLFLYEDTKIQHKVAIKRFHKRDENLFLREVVALANFNHENICTIREYFSEDDFFWIVMPYFQGENLEEKIDKQGSYSTNAALYIIHKIANALSYIHKETKNKPKILHRDIKPSNIFITSEGVPVLLDFGISKTFIERDQYLTQNWRTEGYSCPELWENGEYLSDLYSDKHDIFSLGAVAYELISGKKLIMSSHKLSEDFEGNILKLPKDIANVLTKMISYWSIDSYEDTKALLEDLNNIKINEELALAELKSNILSPKTVKAAKKKKVKVSKEIVKNKNFVSLLLWISSISLIVAFLIYFGKEFSGINDFSKPTGDLALKNVQIQEKSNSEIDVNKNNEPIQNNKTQFVNTDVKNAGAFEVDKNTLNSFDRSTKKANEDFLNNQEDSKIDCKNIKPSLGEYYISSNKMNLKKMESFYADFLEQAYDKSNRKRSDLINNLSEDFKGYQSLHSEINWDTIKVELRGSGCRVELRQIITIITKDGFKKVTPVKSVLLINDFGKIFFFQDWER